MKNLKQILGFCGACIAFYIGAGFATMQEVMQYEASYGSLFGVVILVAAVIYVYTNISFTNNGNRLGLTLVVTFIRHIVVSGLVWHSTISRLCSAT